MEYKKNDICKVTIEDVGTDGEGIGKIDGYTLFIKDAVIGDVVKAKIVKPKKNYAYARVEEILIPSKDRVEPVCPYHRQCGGCQIQALSYEKQLEYKENKVRNNLIRLGKFDADFVDQIMEPIVGMEDPYHYRNKAQFPMGYNRDHEIITGFYAGRTHDIIANTDCKLGVAENQLVLEAVLDYMKKQNVTAYEEMLHKGLIRHVLIRKGFTSGQLMVCLVINGKSLPATDDLIEKLKKIDGMTSISINQNTEKTNVILGKETITIWGQDAIEDTIHILDTKGDAFIPNGEEVTFRISPNSFYQVNPKQTEKLYSLALSYAALTGTETVWDLYCGIGTISLFLAKHAGKVYGVEIIPQAIEDAKQNAIRNGIENASFFVGKAEEVLPDFYEKEMEKREGNVEGENASSEMLTPDVIVVDPPRKGCDELCLETMLKMQPKRIVYVSCDSATLARDLRILVDGGYELEKVRAVDQFGQTVHVESVCLLQRVSMD